MREAKICCMCKKELDASQSRCRIVHKIRASKSCNNRQEEKALCNDCYGKLHEVLGFEVK